MITRNPDAISEAASESTSVICCESGGSASTALVANMLGAGNDEPMDPMTRLNSSALKGSELSACCGCVPAPFAVCRSIRKREMRIEAMLRG